MGDSPLRVQQHACRSLPSFLFLLLLLPWGESNGGGGGGGGSKHEVVAEKMCASENGERIFPVGELGVGTAGVF